MEDKQYLVMSINNDGSLGAIEEVSKDYTAASLHAKRLSLTNPGTTYKVFGSIVAYAAQLISKPQFAR